jgi:ribonuclease Y
MEVNRVNLITWFAVAAAVILSGVLIFIIIKKKSGSRLIINAKREADEIKKRAQEETEKAKREVVLQEKEKFLNLKANFEKQTHGRQHKLNETERRLVKKEEKLDGRIQGMERKEREITNKESRLFSREQEISNKEKKQDELRNKTILELERIASLSKEEAKLEIKKKIEDEAKLEAVQIVRRIEEQAREKGHLVARDIISQAIQRSAAEHVVETTVSVVDLPTDDMKGRIIGREGRNIRALEMATGVDIIVDDTPEAVILSSFDPIRREMARLAIEKLVVDGRISYGQNVLQHSREVAFLSALMARELGVNVNVAMRAGLLHDIGKAVDRELEGTHTELSVSLAKKYGEKEAVWQAIASHHRDIEFPSVEAVLVQSADTLSAARPGARRELLEAYIKRLEKLEEVANSYEGVAKAFALQAGREIRVIVESKKISDEQATLAAKDIARKIKDELDYPGHIKVTVIREMRAVEYAR